MLDKLKENLIFSGEILKHIDLEFMVLDQQKKILYHNQAFLNKFLNHQSLDNYDQLLSLSLDDNEKEMFEYYFQQSLRGEKVNFEWKVCQSSSNLEQKNGYVLVSFKKMEDQSDLVFIFFRDITIKRQVEIELAKKNKELQTVFESMIDTYFILDKEGGIKTISPSILLLCGYEPYEIDKDDFGVLFKNTEQKNEILTKVETYGVLEDFEAEFCKSDGESSIVSININLIYDDQENPIGFEGFIRDINERFQMEKEIRQSREEMKIVNKSLERLSRTDPLTLLSNRRDIMEKIEEEKRRFVRNRKVFSILLIDIDEFKRINDTYGHDGGDRVLVNLSEMFVSNLRKMDKTARWGGEEFIILLPETAKKGSKIIAERIRGKTQNLDIQHKNKKIKITITIGVSSFTSNSESIEECIKQADIALYNGKKTGRNKVIEYSKSLTM